MTLREDRLVRLARCLDRENALFLALLAKGRTLQEAEEALRLCEMWILWGLCPPRAALKGVGQRGALRYNPLQPVRTGHF